MPKLVLEDDALVRIEPITGEIPSPLSPPPGCHYHPRCPIVVERCRTDDPQPHPMGPSRFAACHLATPD